MTDPIRANRGQFKKGHKIQPKVHSQLTHGLGSTRLRDPIYSTWSRMKRRCYNSNSKDFARYGGKGVAVADRWRNSFVNFHKDMADSWFPGASIDRIDNSKGYSKENCRWATVVEQARNKTTVTKYTYQGKTLTIPEWAEIYDIKPRTLYARLKIYKWPVERALLNVTT